jgi:hypothetical protein
LGSLVHYILIERRGLCMEIIGRFKGGWGRKGRAFVKGEFDAGSPDDKEILMHIRGLRMGRRDLVFFGVCISWKAGKKERIYGCV